MSLHHLHVFYSATKGVGDSTIMDGFLAKPKIRQFNVPCRRNWKVKVLLQPWLGSQSSTDDIQIIMHPPTLPSVDKDAFPTLAV